MTTYTEIIKLAAGKNLEKSKKEDEDIERTKPGIGSRIAYNAVPSLAASAGALGLARWVKPSKIKIRPELHEHLAKHLNLKKDIPWEVTSPVTSTGDDAFVRKIKKTFIPGQWAKSLFGLTSSGDVAVVAPRHSPEFLAHELGHAKSYEKLPIKPMMLARSFGPLVSGTAGSMMAMRGKPKSWTRRLAIPVAALGTLPTLVDEFEASRKGYGALKSYGKFAPHELKTMRHNLYKAFGTYGITAAATVAPAALITLHRVLKERKLRQLEEEKKKGRRV